MKVTLNIDATVMARLKREAAQQRRTMSELVETALGLLFQAQDDRSLRKLPVLPSFRSGGHVVDVSDREVLCRALDGR